MTPELDLSSFVTRLYGSFSRFAQDVRGDTELSQPRFCEVYGFNLSTLRGWEQGRRVPGSAEIMYYLCIQEDPDLVARIVSDVID